jgi:hypothetical protein
MNVGTVALPSGPYDWHPERIPTAVGQHRIAELRAIMTALGLRRAVIHGNVFDHGGLTWLTGFTPKLGPAYALVPLIGPLRLLFSGGPGMKPSAERLTWVGDVTALRGIGGDLGAWLSDTSDVSGNRLGLYEGAGMALDDWRAIGKAAGAPVESLDAPLDTARRAKTGLELNLIRRSCAALDAMASELSSRLQTEPVRVAALAAERAAYALDAQDARVRVGRSAWAPPRSVEGLLEKIDGPLRVAIATRANGYWATGEFVAAPLPSDLARTAITALTGAIAALRPGAGLQDIRAVAGLGATIEVDGIGLSPSEQPHLSEPSTRLSVRDVCSVTISLPIGPDRKTARWSAIAAVGDGSPEILWKPPGLDIP